MKLPVSEDNATVLMLTQDANRIERKSTIAQLCLLSKMACVKETETERCVFAFTSGLFSAVSMAKPGPKPVSDLTLVEVGSGRLH